MKIRVRDNTRPLPKRRMDYTKAGIISPDGLSQLCVLGWAGGGRVLRERKVFQQPLPRFLKSRLGKISTSLGGISSVYGYGTSFIFQPVPPTQRITWPVRSKPSSEAIPGHEANGTWNFLPTKTVIQFFFLRTRVTKGGERLCFFDFLRTPHAKHPCGRYPNGNTLLIQGPSMKMFFLKPFFGWHSIRKRNNQRGRGWMDSGWNFLLPRFFDERTQPPQDRGLG